MTDDYIYRDDAVSRISDLLIFDLKMTRCPTWNEVYNAIGELPSADVVPVVRCKDCEWAVKSTELPGWYMCKCEEAFDYYAKPDDFCSHGKRREE